MKTKEHEDFVRFAVYDSFGNFLGYKGDTFWALIKEEKYAKAHPAKDAGLSSHLFCNLLTSLNKGQYYEHNLAKKGHFDERHSLYVIAEDIKSGEPISNACIKNMARKRYAALSLE